MKPSVYLAGPISGLTYKDADDWRRYAKQYLNKLGIEAYSPTRAKEYLASIGKLAPAGQNYNGLSPLSENKGIVARDRMDCTGRSLVLANLLGSTQVSIGTCIEFGWADSAKVPIVLAIEKENNPHEHGMLVELAGYRVESLEAALDITASILLP